MRPKLRIFLLALMAIAAIFYGASIITGLTAEISQDKPLSDRVPAGQSRSNPVSLAPVNLPTHVPGQLSSPIRAIRLDYKEMADSRKGIDALEQNIIASGLNLVSLGAGRAEWTYFNWAGHTDALAKEVRDTGIDFLAEDTARFGRWAYVDASVDVLSPLYIQKVPQAAAISYDGVASPNLVSTMQLVEGPYGKLLLEMIRAIASTYAVDSISINEMYYQRDGYGPDDKAAFMQVTGRPDWPRRADGLIDIKDQIIGDWRSFELSRWLSQAQDIAHQYGKSFFVNISLNLNDPRAPVLDYGQSLGLLQARMDKVLLWGFFDPETISAEDLTSAARILKQNDSQHKFIFVVGLWNKLNLPIAAQKLTQAATAVQQGGLEDIWITPASLVNADHWLALSSIWKRK